MTTLTILGKPFKGRDERTQEERERDDSDNSFKILNSLTLDHLNQLSKIATVKNLECDFIEWLEQFINNDLFLISTNELDEITGFITAKRNRVILQNGEASKDDESIKVTLVYSHPRNLDQEKDLVHAFLEAAVRLDYRYLSVPNTTELMRNLADYAVSHIASVHIEVMPSHCNESDLLDLKDFKIYGQANGTQRAGSVI